MNIEKDMIVFAFGVLLAVIQAGVFTYIKFTNARINRIERDMHGKIESARISITELKVQSASAQVNAIALGKVQDEVSSMGRVLYQIAGHLGIAIQGS
jgi:hypothetical protein